MSYDDERELPYIRSEDQIEDDMAAITNAKSDFLAAMDRACKHLSKEAIDEHYIAIEQMFDDMVSAHWERLCDELGVTYADYLLSPRYKAWLAEQNRIRIRPTVNPETLADIGRPL